MKIQDKEKVIIDRFQKLPDWESRYRELIKMGKELPPLNPSEQIEKNLVRGCQSQVWLVARRLSDGRMALEGDSDALLVKGLVALVIQIYDQELPSDVLAHQPHFIQKIGLDSHLTPSRTNGFLSMLKQIRMFAQVYSMMDRSSS